MTWSQSGRVRDDSAALVAITTLASSGPGGRLEWVRVRVGREDGLGGLECVRVRVRSPPWLHRGLGVG